MSTKHKVLFWSVAILLLGGVVPYVQSSTVLAAPAQPGCYASATTTDSNNKPQTTYIIEANSACTTAINDPSINCYVAPQGSSTYAANYSQIDCTTIDSSKVSGYRTGTSTSHHQCGSGDQAVATSIDFGCKGNACLQKSQSPAQKDYCGGSHSAVLDMTFGIIRFLSYGVGFIVVASMVVAGIQYTTSQGDPKAAENAEKRIKATVGALLLYIFAYAILNYVIPQGFFKNS